MFYSQASTVGDESLGPPPLFIWELSSLTTFDRFRGILADYTAARKRSKPSVSFLAAVIDIQAARHVGTGGKQKAEWHLQDPTGQQVTLHIWGSGADVVCDVVRRGDIIFVGGEPHLSTARRFALTISLYQQTQSSACIKTSCNCPSIMTTVPS